MEVSYTNESYDENVVREFYVAITAKVFDRAHPSFKKVTMRNRVHDFSPAPMNTHFGIHNRSGQGDSVDMPEKEILCELTADQFWNFKKTVRPCKLTWEYSVLHIIA